MVGFVKVDCLGLALSRRIFAGNYEEDTVAGARGPALRFAWMCTFSFVYFSPETVAAAADDQDR
jgi:hypothetical protein